MRFLIAFVCVMALFGCAKEDTKTQTTITTNNASITYNLEVARSDQELQTGLMNRKELAKDSGMLFLFNPVRPVAMWMKNTFIPLDMVFINPQGEIVCIKENATPMSEEFIVCDEEVSAVIELNAGEVAKNSIVIGNKVGF